MRFATDIGEYDVKAQDLECGLQGSACVMLTLTCTLSKALISPELSTSAHNPDVHQSRSQTPHAVDLTQAKPETAVYKEDPYIEACKHSCVHASIHMYVCMHACTIPSMHACMFSFMHALMHAFVHTYRHICTYRRAFMHPSCIHAFIRAYIHTCIHASTFMCPYVHAPMASHMHTNIHTYTRNRYACTRMC